MRTVCRLNTLRAAGLVLLASAAADPALARTPWAATSGLHFVDAVVAVSNYRAAAGGLAMKKSPSADVRMFGHMLWKDSIDDTRRLKLLLDKHPPGIVLPSQVSPEYMFEIDRLIQVSGDAFDRRFIAMQTASLDEAVALAEAYARTGDDFDLKEFAAAMVPKLKLQLGRIREIEMRRTGEESPPIERRL
jgi:putative membrane protein